MFWLKPCRKLGFHFCPDCGCVAYWRGLEPNAQGRRRMAVHLRPAEPAEVAAVVIEHFDGLESLTDLGRDGRCVRDMWFQGGVERPAPLLRRASGPAHRPGPRLALGRLDLRGEELAHLGVELVGREPAGAPPDELPALERAGRGPP